MVMNLTTPDPIRAAAFPGSATSQDASLQHSTDSIINEEYGLENGDDSRSLISNKVTHCSSSSSSVSLKKPSTASDAPQSWTQASKSGKSSDKRIRSISETSYKLLKTVRQGQRKCFVHYKSFDVSNEKKGSFEYGNEMLLKKVIDSWKNPR